MNVKELLKDKNITLSKFAEDFKLSRNTAMQYIEKYDAGEKIPKEKYQIVFDRLFDVQNNEKFELSYASLKYLIERDNYNGILEMSPENTDSVMKIFNNLISEIENNRIDSDMLYFINACIYNSTNEIVFKTLAKYFYFFNNLKIEDYQELSLEEKAIYTNYFKVFSLQKNNMLTIDERIEELFLSRLSEINKLKQYYKDEVKKID